MTVIPQSPVDLQLHGRYPFHDISNDFSPYEKVIFPDQIVRLSPQTPLQLLQDLSPTL